MTKIELTALTGKLNTVRTNLNAAGQPANAQIERLYDDLLNYYQADYDELPKAYRSAWDESVKRRLAAFGAVHATISAEFSRFKADWTSAAKTATLNIYFGQIRVGPSFAQAGNVNQQAVFGLPNIVGQMLTAIQGLLTAGTILADEIPVQIFQSNNKWISINNRGYTVHCMANVRPLRLFPRVPSQAERLRLNDREGVHPIGHFTYHHAAVGGHLTNQPHTLPSNEMPVTTGPNTWQIQRVVRVPQGWL